MAAAAMNGVGAPVPMPEVVAASPVLEHGLASVEEASRHFASPDPAIRSQGEAVFLHLRHDSHAIEHSLFALQKSRDPFVQFQVLSVILDNLASLSLDRPSTSLASLATLRDFLLAFAFARSDLAASTESPTERANHAWPHYVRVKTYQTIAAVQVRLLGLELQRCRDARQSYSTALESFASYVSLHILDEIAAVSRSVYGSNSNQTLHMRFNVCSGILASLIDDAAGFNLQHSGASTSARKQEKARAVDFAGLSSLQRRWVKGAMQMLVLDKSLALAVETLSKYANEHARESFLPILTPFVSLLEHCLRWTFINDPFVGLETELNLDQTSALLASDPVQDEDELDEGGSSHGSGIKVRLSRREVPSTSSAFLSPDLVKLIAHLHTLASQLNTSNNRDAALSILRLRRCLLLVARFIPTARDRASVSPESVTMRASALLEACESVRALIDTHLCGPLKIDECKASLLILQIYDETFSTFSSIHDVFASFGMHRLLELLRNETHRAYFMACTPKSSHDEDEEVASLAEESVSAALSAWLTLAQSQAGVRAILSEWVVNPYIEQRLKGAAESVTGSDETSEVGDETQPDHVIFNEQLILVATLGRSGRLTQVIDAIKEQLGPIVRRLSSFYEAAGPVSVSPQDLNSLEVEWEKMHWVTLICGHILSDDNLGEMGCIPREVEQLPPIDQEAIGDLIQVLSLQIVGILLKASPDRPQSPQVLQTLFWFTARWIPSYLLTRSASSSLTTIFSGRQGEEILTFIVKHLGLAMRAWVADADVLLQIAAVLLSLSKSEHTKTRLLSMPDFEELVGAVLHDLASLPSKTHKPLISALIGCVYASSAGPQAEYTFQRITQSIEVRLSNILHQDDFASPQVFQRAEVVDDVQNALDLFDGLAASIQPRSRRAVYDFLSRFFTTFVDLTKMYADRTEVVTATIRIMRDIVCTMDLSFGVEDDIVSGLVKGIWHLIESLDEKCLISTSPTTSLEDEVPFEGLCLVLDMLIDLKFASDDDLYSPPSAWASPLSNEKASDVCLLGFSRVLPLLKGVILEVPRVRTSLADLQSGLFVSFPHRMVGLTVQSNEEHRKLGATIFVNCSQALALSLQFDETSIVVDALNAAEALAKAVPRVLLESNGVGTQSCIQDAQQLVTSTLLSLADAILRATLLEPVAPAMFASYTKALHLLVASASVTAAAAAGQQGGYAILQNHFESFCAETSLQSHGTASRDRGQFIGIDGGSSEERRRRATLADVVARLIGQLLSSAELALKRDSMTARSREDEGFSKIAQEIAWHGRALLQTR